MYEVSQSLNATGECLALIIPVDEIHRSVHLYPKFGPIAPHDWTSSNILERCTSQILASMPAPLSSVSCCKLNLQRVLWAWIMDVCTRQGKRMRRDSNTKYRKLRRTWPKVREEW
jgi:hypothetical protein